MLLTPMLSAAFLLSAWRANLAGRGVADEFGGQTLSGKQAGSMLHIIFLDGKAAVGNAVHVVGVGCRAAVAAGAVVVGEFNDGGRRDACGTARCGFQTLELLHPGYGWCRFHEAGLVMHPDRQNPIRVLPGELFSHPS